MNNDILSATVLLTAILLLTTAIFAGLLATAMRAKLRAHQRRKQAITPTSPITWQGLIESNQGNLRAVEIIVDTETTPARLCVRIDRLGPGEEISLENVVTNLQDRTISVPNGITLPKQYN